MNNLEAGGTYTKGGNWVPNVENCSHNTSNQLKTFFRPPFAGTGCELLGQLITYCFGANFPNNFSKMPIDNALQNWPQPPFLSKELLQRLNLPLNIAQSLNDKIGGKGKIIVGGSVFHKKLQNVNYFKNALAKIDIDSDSLFPKYVEKSVDEKLKIYLLIPAEYKQDLKMLKDSITSGVIKELKNEEFAGFCHELQGVKTYILNGAVSHKKLFSNYLSCDITDANVESYALNFYDKPWSCILNEFITLDELRFDLLDLAASIHRGESSFTNRYQSQMIERAQKEFSITQIARKIKDFLCNHEMLEFKTIIGITFQLCTTLQLSKSESKQLWDKILDDRFNSEDKSVAGKIASLLKDSDIPFDVIASLVEVCSFLHLNTGEENVRYIEIYDTCDYKTNMYHATFQCGTTLAFQSNPSKATEKLKNTEYEMLEKLLPLYSSMLPSHEKVNKTKSHPFDTQSLLEENHPLLNHLTIYINAISNNGVATKATLAMLPSSLSINCSEGSKLCFWNTMREGFLGQFNPFYSDKTPDDSTFKKLLNFLKSDKSILGKRLVKKTYLSHAERHPEQSALLAKEGAKIFFFLDLLERADFLKLLSDKEILSSNDCLKKMKSIINKLKNENLTTVHWRTLSILGKIAINSLSEDLKIRKKGAIEDALKWLAKELITLHDPLTAFKICELYPFGNARTLLCLETLLSELLKSNRYNNNFLQLFHLLVRNGVEVTPLQISELTYIAKKILNTPSMGAVPTLYFLTDLDHYQFDKASLAPILKDISLKFEPLEAFIALKMKNTADKLLRAIRKKYIKPQSKITQILITPVNLTAEDFKIVNRAVLNCPKKYKSQIGRFLYQSFQTLSNYPKTILAYVKLFSQVEAKGSVIEVIKEKLPELINQSEVYQHLKNLPINQSVEIFNQLESKGLITNKKNGMLSELFLHFALAHFRAGEIKEAALYSDKIGELVLNAKLKQDLLKCISYCLELPQKLTSLSLFFKFKKADDRPTDLTKKIYKKLTEYFEVGKLVNKNDFAHVIQFITDLQDDNTKLCNLILRSTASEKKSSSIVKSELTNRMKIKLLKNVKKLIGASTPSSRISIRIFLSSQVAISLFTENEMNQLQELFIKNLPEEGENLTPFIKSINVAFNNAARLENLKTKRKFITLLIDKVLSHSEINRSLKLFNLLVKMLKKTLPLDVHTNEETEIFIQKMLRCLPDKDGNIFLEYVKSISTLAECIATNQTRIISPKLLLSLILFCQGEISIIKLPLLKYGEVMDALFLTILKDKNSISVERCVNILDTNRSRIHSTHLINCIDQLVDHYSNQQINEKDLLSFAKTAAIILLHWKTLGLSSSSENNQTLCLKLVKGILKPCEPMLGIIGDPKTEMLLNGYYILAWQVIKMAHYYEVFNKENSMLMEIYSSLSLAVKVIEIDKITNLSDATKRTFEEKK